MKMATQKIKVSQAVKGLVSFATWLRGVDMVLARRFHGMGHLDLPDWCWRDMFDAEISPVEAVDEFVLEAEMNPY